MSVSVQPSGKHKIVAKKTLNFFFAFLVLSGKLCKHSLTFRAAINFIFGLSFCTRTSIPCVWLCLSPSVTDGSQPLSGLVMCEHYWLSVLCILLMWVTLLLKNRYESKEEERFLFIEKEKMLCFFSFPEKEFLLFPVARQPGELLWDDRALANRHVFGCGQGCFSSVLISFFFVSSYLYQCYPLMSLYCFPFTWVISIANCLASPLLRNLWTFATLGLSWDRTSWIIWSTGDNFMLPWKWEQKKNKGQKIS
jgi:hypothetical protein